MSRRRGFSLCALSALSPVLQASGTPADPASSPTTDPANEHGVPALFSWADIDGDGRLDLAAVSGAGTFQLLANTGAGRFEDVTERLGLAGVPNASLALWADYDSDGLADLFVGAREGASRLFHNEHGVFVDMSAGSGLTSEGAVQSAQWLDLDGDGRLDLFVVTAKGSELFRGLEGGFFERAELPLAGAVSAPELGGAPVVVEADASGHGAPSDPASPEETGSSHAAASTGELAARRFRSVASPWARARASAARRPTSRSPAQKRSATRPTRTRASRSPRRRRWASCSRSPRASSSPSAATSASGRRARSRGSMSPAGRG
jgi:hypothetical protein